MQHLRSWAGGHLSRRICLHLPAGRSPRSLLSSFTLPEQNPDSLKASRALCVLHYCHDAPRRASHLPQVDASEGGSHQLGIRERLCPRECWAWRRLPGQRAQPELMELREHWDTALSHRVWLWGLVGLGSVILVSPCQLGICYCYPMVRSQ